VLVRRTEQNVGVIEKFEIPRSRLIGEQKSALSSKLILASSVTTSPSWVPTSGLISTSEASRSTKARERAHEPR
jgi:hypothetical protein